MDEADITRPWGATRRRFDVAEETDRPRPGPRTSFRRTRSGPVPPAEPVASP